MTTKEISREPSETNISVEDLFQASYKRMQDRLAPAVLAMLAFFGMLLGSYLVIGIAAGLIFGVYMLTKSLAVTVTLGIVATLAALSGLLFVAAWGQLAMIYVVISEKKVGVMEAFRKMKEISWGYVGFTFFMGLFLLGILPISIPTVFILYFVWAIFSVFAPFVYIEKKLPGLQPLWVSAAMFDKRFWGVFGRLVVLYAAFYGIMFALMLLANISEALFNLFYFAFIIISGPFALAYMYELYKAIPHPTNVKRQTAWIIVSVIGWIIMIFGIMSLVANAPNMEAFGEEFNKGLQEEMMKQEMNSI